MHAIKGSKVYKSINEVFIIERTYITLQSDSFFSSSMQYCETFLFKNITVKS
jgi:hypothetical protein